MNKFFTKIIGASLAIAMMIGVGAGINFAEEAKEVNATDYTKIATFDFANHAAASGTTGLTNDTIKSLLNTSSDVSNIVTSVTNKTGDVYNGKGSGGGSIPQKTLKIGKASGGGAFTFTIGGNDNISKVVVNGHVWKDTSSISVNTCAAQTYATVQSADAHPFVFELAAASKTISINVTTSAVCVSSIELYKANGGGQEEVTVTGITKKTAPTKTAYYPGESFEAGGLAITVSYSNGSSADVTYDEHPSDFEWTPETITEAGDVEIQYKDYSEMKVTQAVALVTPLTVAEAKNAIDAADNNTVPNAYVQGIISQIDGYNDSYHSITYWISDDGTTSNQFEVYSGKGLNGANFASVDDIELGATVVVYGTMKLYGQNPAVYEFTQNSRLKSYTEPVKTLVSISLSGNFKTAYYTSESLSTQGLVVTAKYDNGSTKDVTDQAVISDPATAQARRSSVTVSYTEGGVTKTASYRIVARTRIQSRFNPFNGETVTEGDYIIYYNGRALKNTIASNRASFEEITLNGSTYYTTNDNIVWHIAKEGDYYTIYNAAIKKYLAATDNKNQAQFIADNTDNKAKWTITSPSTGEYEFENLARKNSGSDPNNKWLRNNGTNGFACYATATGGALTIYKEEARTEIENQVTQTSLSYQYTLDDGVYTYSHAAIRFTGSVNVQTWKDLDSQYHIQGYGIMFAETSVLDVYGPSKTIKSLYEPIRNYYSSVDECFVTSGGKQYLNGYVNKIKYFYTELADSESHPAQVGNEYGWNLYKNLDDSLDGASATALTTSYTAVAFIRTQLGELFFMNEESVSAGELAFRNLYNGTEFSNDEVRESMEQMACLDIAA